MVYHSKVSVTWKVMRSGRPPFFQAKDAGSACRSVCKSEGWKSHIDATSLKAIAQHSGDPRTATDHLIE